MAYAEWQANVLHSPVETRVSDIVVLSMTRGEAIRLLRWLDKTVPVGIEDGPVMEALRGVLAQ